MDVELPSSTMNLSETDNEFRLFIERVFEEYVVNKNKVKINFKSALDLIYDRYYDYRVDCSNIVKKYPEYFSSSDLDNIIQGRMRVILLLNVIYRNTSDDLHVECRTPNQDRFISCYSRQLNRLVIGEEANKFEDMINYENLNKIFTTPDPITYSRGKYKPFISQLMDISKTVYGISNDRNKSIGDPEVKFLIQVMDLINNKQISDNSEFLKNKCAITSDMSNDNIDYETDSNSKTMICLEEIISPVFMEDINILDDSIKTSRRDINKILKPYRDNIIKNIINNDDINLTDDYIYTDINAVTGQEYLKVNLLEYLIDNIEYNPELLKTAIDVLKNNNNLSIFKGETKDYNYKKVTYFDRLVDELSDIVFKLNSSFTHTTKQVISSFDDTDYNFYIKDNNCSYDNKQISCIERFLNRCYEDSTSERTDESITRYAVFDIIHDTINNLNKPCKINGKEAYCANDIVDRINNLDKSEMQINIKNDIGYLILGNCTDENDNKISCLNKLITPIEELGNNYSDTIHTFMINTMSAIKYGYNEPVDKIQKVGLHGNDDIKLNEIEDIDLFITKYYEIYSYNKDLARQILRSNMENFPQLFSINVPYILTLYAKSNNEYVFEKLYKLYRDAYLEDNTLIEEFLQCTNYIYSTTYKSKSENLFRQFDNDEFFIKIVNCYKEAFMLAIKHIEQYGLSNYYIEEMVAWLKYKYIGAYNYKNTSSEINYDKYRQGLLMDLFNDEYIFNTIRQSEKAFGLFLQWFDSTKLLSLLKTKMKKDEMCKTIHKIFDNDKRIKENSYKYIKALNECDQNCELLSGKDRRSCYDNRCFDMVLTENDDSNDWIRENIDRPDGMEYRPEMDSLNLCGVYEINYDTSTDDKILSEYSSNIASFIRIISRKVANNPIQIKTYDREAKKHNIKYGYPYINFTRGTIHDSEDVRFNITVNYYDQETDELILETEVPFAKLASKLKFVKTILNEDKELMSTYNGLQTSKPAKNIQKLYVVISNRPHDIMRVSTCQGWQSCFNLFDGQYHETVHSIIDYGGYVAYLATDEFAPTWLARTFIHRCNGTLNSVAVQFIYGLPEYKNLLTDSINKILHDKGLNKKGGHCSVDWDDTIIDSEKEDIDCNNANVIELCKRAEYDNVYEILFELNKENYLNEDGDFFKEEIDYKIESFVEENGRDPDDDEMDEIKEDTIESIKESYIEPSDEEIQEELNNRCDCDGVDIEYYIEEYRDQQRREYDDEDNLFDGYQNYIDSTSIDRISQDDINLVMKKRGDNFIKYMGLLH